MIKKAILEKDRTKVETYRSIKTAIQMAKTAKGAKPYDDAVEVALLKKMAKSLNDGVNQFLAAGRKDLADEYSNQYIIVTGLLPKEPTEDEVEAIVAGLDPNMQMGEMVKAVKAALPTVDGKLMMQVIRHKIGN